MHVCKYMNYQHQLDKRGDGEWKQLGSNKERGAGQPFLLASLHLVNRHHVLILGVQAVCWAEIAPSAWILAPSTPPPRSVVTGAAGASALF